MTSRERVLAALRREKPDLVPYIEIGVDPAVADQLLGRTSGGASPPVIIEANQRTVEEEKVLARAMHKDNITYVLRAPVFADRVAGEDGRLFYADGQIRSRADLEKLVLPDPTSRELYRELETFVAGKEDFALFLATRAGVFAAALSMGLERFFLALHDDRPFVEQLMDRYTDWAVAVAERACAMDIDVFLTTDDFAWKQGPMVSPELFREAMLPRLRRVGARITKPWLLHSDGNIVPLVEDLLSLGIDGLHSLEPEALDIREVKRRWGDRVCLVGNVSLVTLGRGTPEEVEAEAKGLIRDLGRDGGYMLSSSNSIASYVPVENALAMGRAAAVNADLGG
jgi:uroporphyrinogen decarboxylase